MVEQNLYQTKLLDNNYIFKEVDESMGGKDCKVLHFYINGKLSDIEEELDNYFTKYRRFEISSDLLYKYLQIYDEWNKLCN